MTKRPEYHALAQEPPRWATRAKKEPPLSAVATAEGDPLRCGAPAPFTSQFPPPTLPARADPRWRVAQRGLTGQKPPKTRLNNTTNRRPPETAAAAAAGEPRGWPASRRSRPTSPGREKGSGVGPGKGVGSRFRRNQVRKRLPTPFPGPVPFFSRPCRPL